MIRSGRMRMRLAFALIFGAVVAMAIPACRSSEPKSVERPLGAFDSGQSADSGASASVFDDVDGEVRAFVMKHEVPGLSIAIVVDGKLAWTKGYGLADVESRVAVTPTTAFRTGSIGKTMTATAAMQLVEQHRLDLGGDVRRYCPAFPAKPWTITPRDLLSHLSGIRHYGGPRDKEEQSSTVHYATVADALAPFKDDPLLFEPGTKWQYSSYGYDVLGCVIEGAAGAPFLAYMKSHVWDPARMTATRDDDSAAAIPERAAGYVRVDGTIRRAPAVDMTNRMPAGGYVTTVVDYARFIEAMFADRLVDATTFAQMITPAKLRTGEAVPYGLGWGMELDDWHGDRWTFHGGSTPGASGMVALMPGHRFGVVFLTNLEDLPERSELAEQVASTVLRFRSAPSTDAAAPPAVRSLTDASR
jgi:serine beta-lactamase-like protein LACTB